MNDRASAGDWRQSLVSVAGIWAAKIWIVLPALVSLPIMWLFGEGDYIVPVWGLLWMACFSLDNVSANPRQSAQSSDHKVFT
jgi:hypothetical protein